MEVQFHLRSANTLWQVVTVCTAALTMCGIACVAVRHSFVWRRTSPKWIRAFRHIVPAAPVVFHWRPAFLSAL
jgi:hypothetical protein